MKSQWEKINLEADYIYEGEIVCASCGNYNSSDINPDFAFYEYTIECGDFEYGTVLCQTCIEADGIDIN